MKTHIVKNGETLWNIAKKYHINFDQLKNANSISNSNLIFPGQKINIPEPGHHHKGTHHNVDYHGKKSHHIKEHPPHHMSSLKHKHHAEPTSHEKSHHIKEHQAHKHSYGLEKHTPTPFHHAKEKPIHKHVHDKTTPFHHVKEHPQPNHNMYNLENEHNQKINYHDEHNKHLSMNSVYSPSPHNYYENNEVNETPIDIHPDIDIHNYYVNNVDVDLEQQEINSHNTAMHPKMGNSPYGAMNYQSHDMYETAYQYPTKDYCGYGSCNVPTEYSQFLTSEEAHYPYSPTPVLKDNMSSSFTPMTAHAPFSEMHYKPIKETPIINEFVDNNFYNKAPYQYPQPKPSYVNKAPMYNIPPNYNGISCSQNKFGYNYPQMMNPICSPPFGQF